MARTGGVVNFNTFVGGLITEASPLTFPENATLREENFELRRDGTRARRFGMDFEAGSVSTNTVLKETLNESVLMSYEWFNAGNSENENFLIVQLGQFIHIYDMSTSPISDNRRVNTIDLSEHLTSSSEFLPVEDFPISVTALKGYLVIVSPVIEPLYVTYDAESGIFSTSRITVQTRDLFGTEDETISVDHRPSELTSKHLYNLRNQGWLTDDITKTFTDLSVYPSNADIAHIAKQTSYDPAETGFNIDDIGTYNPTYLERELFGTTPAPRGKFIYNVFNREYQDLVEGNALDISSVFYNGVNLLTITTSGVPHGLSETSEIQLKDIGIIVSWEEAIADYNTTETKTAEVVPSNNNLSGRFFEVVSVPSPTTFTISWNFNLENDTAYSSTLYRTDKTIDSFITTNSKVVVPSTAIVDINEEEKFRFKATAGYAGRAWYGGIDSSSTFGSYIFFSQILEDNSKIGKCYQEADPTSEHISDLVDTDGGFIVIPEAKNIQAMVPSGQYLFIFSTNGVWRVFGDDGGNFRATGYSVEKVSDIGINARFSIVSVESEIYYWGVGGIYKISQQEVSGTFIATNISQLTIQSEFFNVGGDQQTFVKGSYDPTEKKITWMFNRASNTVTSDYNYNTFLIFDTLLGAFYKYLLPIDSDGTTPFIGGIFTTPNLTALESSRQIISGTDTVIAGTNNVVDLSTLPRDNITQTKYLTVVPSDSANYYITFSELNNISFLDYESFDSTGTDAAASMITGSDTQGSQAIKKQAHYLLMYFNRTEQLISLDESNNMVADNSSSCLVNILWDWSTDINSVRAGSQFQAYRPSRYYLPTETTDPYTYGEDVIVSKSKLRGRGRAFSMAIQSEPGKDLHIYGWSLVVSAGRRP